MFFLFPEQLYYQWVSEIICKWSEKSPPQQVPTTTAATEACTINNYWVTGMIKHDRAIKPSGSQI